MDYLLRPPIGESKNEFEARLSGIDGLRSLILFGSKARGESDEFSDLDLCLLADDLPFSAVKELRIEAAKRCSTVESSLTVYTASVAKCMRRKGSLFLWHLKLEGEILLDLDGFAASLLAELPAFDGFEAAICSHESLWRDVQENLARRGRLSEFDYHILHGVIRDCCILLCFDLASPAFGRISAFEGARRLVRNLPVDALSFSELTAWHLTYARNAPPPGPLPDQLFAERAIRSTGSLIELCKDLLT